ncbi:MAG: dTMP kinase [Alphaproteobacteria bacterium]|nr:dTMP kinase [Alphaproteobacteria bacterium]MDE2336976.1 dTMP kinase [Alphaproteobacteria bacterium]
MSKGVFITLEGGDGTGKSTQIKLLQQALSAAGVDVMTTREPGGTRQAERIRDLLLQRDSGNFDPMTEALLLFAARREHLVEKIWPALGRGQWVVSDRFADSSRAFQGYGMGLDMRVIEDLYRMVAGDFQPDITFILDIDPELGLQRSMRRHAAAAVTEDRYERMGLAFHQRLRDGFREIAKRFPGRCVVIDATQDVEAVHGAILGNIAARTGVRLKETQDA